MMITSKGLVILLNDLGFKPYDSNYEIYLKYINELISKYDYQSVINNIQDFLNHDFKGDKRAINDLLNFFKSRMDKKRYQPKLSEQDYIDQEQRDWECWVKISGRTEMKDESELDYIKHPHYRKYNGRYLTKIAKERRCSVHHLCEIQGLIPDSITY